MRRALAALLLVPMLALVGCGSDDDNSSTTTTAPGGNAALSGDVGVFAAASLTEAFTDLQNSLQTSDPDLSLEYHFAGSQALVRQIQDGGPADVFASADEKNMQTLVDAGLIESPQIFARNRLAIAVAPGNPKDITSLADLQRDGVTLVLAAATVPAGNYARQAFEQAGLPAPKPASEEIDVKSTLAKLTSGEADAVVVYYTDVVAAGEKVEAVEIPDEHNVLATYPIAVVKATDDRAAAAAFVEAVVGGAGQDALEKRGFLPPT
jgi:molybdate transport system substrate-binding protein